MRDAARFIIVVGLLAQQVLLRVQFKLTYFAGAQQAFFCSALASLSFWRLLSFLSLFFRLRFSFSVASFSSLSFTP